MPVRLSDVLRTVARDPRLLLCEWNCKAAAISALLRGIMFFLLNIRAGHTHAVRAMLVELAYGAAAAGFAGSLTQRLRYAVPLRRTALVVLLLLPLLLMLGQAAVHEAMRTPRLLSGLMLSFVFASLASGFNWWAMRQGFSLTSSSVLADLRLGKKWLTALPTRSNRSDY